jgi:hypothetical protein
MRFDTVSPRAAGWKYSRCSGKRLDGRPATPGPGRGSIGPAVLPTHAHMRTLPAGAAFVSGLPCGASQRPGGRRQGPPTATHRNRPTRCMSFPRSRPPLGGDEAGARRDTALVTRDGRWSTWRLHESAGRRATHAGAPEELPVLSPRAVRIIVAPSRAYCRAHGAWSISTINAHTVNGVI